ncbi:McrC family protein [Helicobacter pametensis]|uniref:McrC family protein n=1 Tax=Helicobacter pametensis TaxID=95149 RepID=UPI00048037C3|nr:hypothetical protein [Helicobacter pametensis]
MAIEFGRTIQDCSIIEIENNSERIGNNGLTFYVSMLEELKQKSQDFSFQSFRRTKNTKNLENIVDYRVLSFRKYNGTVSLPSKIELTTSYYVGFYHTTIEGQQVSLTITPRFGEKIANYLYANALGVHLAKSTTSISQDKFYNQWFLALLWIGALEGAITQAHIPKSYVREKKNLTYFRGRLDVGKQILHNLTSPHKMYCQYPKLTYDTPINRTLCKVYKILKKTHSSLFSPSIQGHFSMLNDFGVRDEISMQEIESIRYTPLNRAYQKVIELSKIIISQKGQSNTTLESKSKGQGFFLDMSEVWESYLYKKILSKLEGYEARDCNLDGGDRVFLGSDNVREMRPDFKLMRGDKLVAIMDAKYKNVDSIEKVSREDLYQMMSYMYRYDCDLGIFLTPNNVEGEDIGIAEVTIDNKKRGKILIFSLPLQWLDNEINHQTKEGKVLDFHSKISKLEKDMSREIVGKIKEIL